MSNQSSYNQQLVHVSSNGRLVIPISIRKKLKIDQIVLLRVEKGRIILKPVKPMEESFGEGGKRARQAAIEISIDRRNEVEDERKALRLITRTSRKFS
jgi:AbrB family looped-hinge helix DNA binding protein